MNRLCLLLPLAASLAAQTTPIPDKLVVLTFDDGVVSHATHVAPLLKQYGFGATFFVCEFPPDFHDKSKYMTWEQMGQLSQMGFELASHTRSHTHLSKLTREQFIEELRYVEDKAASLGAPKVVSFAYPSYVTAPMAPGVLAARGYRYARIGGDKPYDPAHDDPYLIPSYTTLATNRDAVLNALRQARDGRVVVLTLHGVPDTAHPWVNTPPELFREYLDFLRDNHYTVIAMRDLDRYAKPAKR
ncbi:MAG: polysaccharide deacetylase family protein [Acidobacteria bacterium]|nr:polysaccharide deacetylase family protein [Acidobacteriota bacterium]